MRWKAAQPARSCWTGRPDVTQAVDPDFWHERWSRNEIGFHKPSYNPQLVAWADHLELKPGTHVLVPLCGKSHDLRWLLDRGCRVTGVEISSLAVEAFFAEQALAYERETIATGWLYRGEGIEIWCGDFLALDFSSLRPIDAVYDRAALVALPAPMRRSYADRLLGLLPPAIRILLVTLDYSQPEMGGPPFAVTADEVRDLFGADCRIEELHAEDCLAGEPRFVSKGLTRLVERVFLLQTHRSSNNEQMA